MDTMPLGESLEDAWRKGEQGRVMNMLLDVDGQTGASAVLAALSSLRHHGQEAMAHELAEAVSRGHRLPRCGCGHLAHTGQCSGHLRQSQEEQAARVPCPCAGTAARKPDVPASLEEALARARTEGRALGHAEAREQAARFVWEGQCASCGTPIEWKQGPASDSGPYWDGHWAHSSSSAPPNCRVTFSPAPPLHIMADHIRKLRPPEQVQARTVREIREVLNFCWLEMRSSVGASHYDRKARQRLGIHGLRLSPLPKDEEAE